MGTNSVIEKDSYVAAFAVAEVEKIYAHESLTFNNTVACEVISNFRERDYTLASDDVVDAITGSIHQAEIFATKGLLDKTKGNILGIEIVRDQSGNTLRESQSTFYNGKLVQTLLEGYLIRSNYTLKYI
ncbi:hypothetical protein Tco_0910486 [Tanacetum coccineum]|uniref:Uncharacterized protein n=1 Tax=Tanacetum coccineum TaxID=301880 RepID=A0ABQ5CW99_9ASTR